MSEVMARGQDDTPLETPGDHAERAPGSVTEPIGVKAAAVRSEETISARLSQTGARWAFQRPLLLGIVGAIALLFLWQVQAILPPFVIAFFLAALLDPTIRSLQKHGYSRVRAILALYLLGACMIGIVIAFVLPLARAQIEDLSHHFGGYYASIQQTTDGLLHRNAPLMRLLGVRQQHLSEILNQNPGKAKIEAALGAITEVLTSTVSRILWLVIIPIATFFLMRDYPILRARVIALFPEAYQDRIDQVSCEIMDVFSAYLRGLAQICALYAIVTTILFSVLGVQYALFLGLLAGLFYAVPYVGQLVTGIAAGSAAYLTDKPTILWLAHPTSGSAGYALTVVLCAVIAQNVFDQIIYPRVVGQSVGLHPVLSIFALMAGATMFNIWGMLVAVPVAASIQIILLSLFPRLMAAPPARLLKQPGPLA